MISTTPLDPGSPTTCKVPVAAATTAALVTARQAQHIADSRLPLIGFTNFLPGFGNACFRSALISLLINLPPLSGWIVSNCQGHLDNSSTTHLLENVIREYFDTNLVGKQARADSAIQRWYRYFNLNKLVDPKDPYETINLGDIRYPASTQQDATEVLFDLMGDIQAELRASGYVFGLVVILQRTNLVQQCCCYRHFARTY